jgi:hypothetical protein
MTALMFASHHAHCYSALIAAGAAAITTIDMKHIEALIQKYSRQ